MTVPFNPTPTFAYPTCGRGGAPILVVCDAPGQRAARIGRPLSEEEKGEFERLAMLAGFDRSDFFYIGLCPQIPEQFKNSESKKWGHVEPHVEHLNRYIVDYKPQCVITFGQLATRALMGRAMRVTKVSGQLHTRPDGLRVFPLISPGFVLRIPEHKEALSGDIRTLRRLVEGSWTLPTAPAIEYEWRIDISDILADRPKIISVDTETTGLIWWEEGVIPITVQLGLSEGRAVAIPVDPVYWPELNDPIKMSTVRAQLKDILEDPRVLKVGHNIKFDAMMLRKFGIEVKGWYHDTQLLWAFIDENAMRKDLASATRVFVPEMAGYSDVFDATVDKSNMRAVPYDQMLPYACGDADATLRLAKVLDAALRREPNQHRCYRRIQFPALLAFLNTVERYGIKINEPYLDTFTTQINTEAAVLQEKLWEAVPGVIKRRMIRETARSGKKLDKVMSLTRPDFIREVLFTEGGFGLTPVQFTAGTADLEDDDEKVASTSTKQHLPYFITRNDAAGEFCRNYTDFTKLSKLGTTYLGDAFRRYICPVDGAIHPSYKLHKANTLRSACLTGDTLITVLDPRGRVPIKDIKAGDWVWSFDDNLDPVPEKVSWSGETKSVTDLVELTFKRGFQFREHATIRCTPDHLIRLRDGTYRQAQFIKPGDRVLSLERNINAQGYRRVYCTGKRAFIEHRRVEQAMGGVVSLEWDGTNVHHINEVKTDNRPSNLIALTAKEHASEHGWTDAKIAKMVATMRARRATGGFKDRVYGKGPDSLNWYDIDPEWAVKVLINSGGRPSVFKDTYGLDYTCVMNKLKMHGIDWEAIKEAMETQRIEELLPKARMCSTIKDASRVLGVSFYKARKLLGADAKYTDYGSLSLTRVLIKLMIHRGQLTKYCAAESADFSTIKTWLLSYGVDYRDIRKRFDADGKWVSANRLRKARSSIHITAASTILRMTQARAEALLASDHNHLILGVQAIKVESTPVYDLTVPGSHNFIANGVCVHNSENPNGQNFPKRSRWASAYQNMFIPRPGFTFVDCDLSQIELRIAAWEAMEPEMLRIYREGGDIHTATAKACMRISDEEWDALTPKERKSFRTKAKAINFGFIYGMGWPKFRVYAKTDYALDYTDKEAQQTRELFFEKYRGLPLWHERKKRLAHQNGFTLALHGAKRHLPSIHSNDNAMKALAERQAVNAPVQRFGSDLGLSALARFTAQADPEEFRIVAFIHDALILECPIGRAEEGASYLRWVMESFPFDNFGLVPPCPILAEPGIADPAFNDLGHMLERPDLAPVKPAWWNDNEVAALERLAGKLAA